MSNAVIVSTARTAFAKSWRDLLERIASKIGAPAKAARA